MCLLQLCCCGGQVQPEFAANNLAQMLSWLACVHRSSTGLGMQVPDPGMERCCSWTATLSPKDQSAACQRPGCKLTQPVLPSRSQKSHLLDSVPGHSWWLWGRDQWLGMLSMVLLILQGTALSLILRLSRHVSGCCSLCIWTASSSWPVP